MNLTQNDRLKQVTSDTLIVGVDVGSQTHCQTAHCGRHKTHFDFGVIAFPIVPYRNLLQTLAGTTADYRSFV